MQKETTNGHELTRINVGLQGLEVEVPSSKFDVRRSMFNGPAIRSPKFLLSVLPVRFLLSAFPISAFLTAAFCFPDFCFSSGAAEEVSHRNLEAGQQPRGRRFAGMAARDQFVAAVHQR
jgi:hypothetical protein